MNKALRLPVILVALMLIAWIGLSFRPKTALVIREGEAATNETFDADTMGPDTIINGRKVSEYATLATTSQPSISAKDPKTWSSATVSLIKASNGKTTIYFVDGSSREVSANLLKLLPGDLQTRLNYEGPQ